MAAELTLSRVSEIDNITCVWVAIFSIALSVFVLSSNDDFSKTTRSSGAKLHQTAVRPSVHKQVRHHVSYPSFEYHVDPV